MGKPSVDVAASLVEGIVAEIGDAVVGTWRPYGEM